MALKMSIGYGISFKDIEVRLLNGIRMTLHASKIEINKFDSELEISVYSAQSGEYIGMFSLDSKSVKIDKKNLSESVRYGETVLKVNRGH